MANYTSTHTGAVIDASVTKVSASGVTQADFTKLNAVTSSATELNLLDGVTSTTAEINILDGVTSTAAEINILDGATLSVTELNYLDGADSSITTLSLPDNTTITVFGASLIDDANASTARSTLNVDVAGTDNSTNVTLVTTSYDYLSLSGQAITLGQIDISDDTNLVGGTGITLTGDTLSTTDGDIVHDSLSGFVANEHIDHSTVTLTAGDGLSGGGDITTNRSFSINVDDASIEINSDTLRVKALGVTNAMLGGSIANAKLSNSSVSYGGISLSLGGSDATPAFDLSDATSLPIIAGTTGTLTVARGGTGATTASGARTNLNVDVAGTDNSTDVTLVTTSHDYLSLSGQAVTLGQVDISDDTNLVGGTGITLTGDTLSTTDSEIVHDNLSGFVANEHIDHSGVSITAGAGLTGGGDITATRDIAVGAGTGVTVNADDIAIGQDVATSADVEFNSVTADIIGDIRGATKFQAKADVALNIGDAVYISGISGNTPTVAIADSNDAAKMPSFGLAASSVSINASVEIITFGTLPGLNTSSFSAGDILYVSTNGTSGNTLTATAPTGESSLLQNIGTVQRSHASAGSIKVGGAGRTNATPNLDDGDIFIGNGSNQAVTASLNTKIESYLDGGTSTANFDTVSIDGTEITATATELNKMDGVTSTTAEINYTDGVTSNIQTQLDLKAPLASPGFSGTATGVNLTLSGDLTVNGSTTTLDTTNLAVEDNLMELNAGVTSNANDAGFLIERGSTGDNAIFMWDESADKFTLGTTTATGTTTGDITLSSTGTLVANVEGAITGDVTGNADTATALATARNFSLTGDVTAGAVSFDGSGNVALATTIAANSVALGTDTTGNYMSDLTEGTGIDISHTPAEGSNGTITLDLTEVGFGGGANRLITDDGDGTVTTESNLTFDGNYLRLSDNKLLIMGAGDAFQIGHKATYSNIATYEGHLYIDNNADDQDIIFRCDNGSGGLTAYLTLDGSAGSIKVAKNLEMADGIRLRAGASDDLQFYHNGGGNSNIDNSSGDLYVTQYTDDGDMIFRCDDGSGGTTAYITLDGSAGTVNIDKEIHLSTHLDMGDGDRIKLGDSDDFQIVHDSNINFIHSTISDRDIYVRVNDGGASVDAIIIDASEAGSVLLPNDGQHLKLGVGGDLGFYVNADDSSVIRAWTSDKDLYFYVNDGGVATPAVQIDASDAGTAIFNQDIRLNTNATYIHLKDASGNQPRMFGINGSNDTYIGPIDSYAGGSILYGTSSNVVDQIFYTGGSERMRIKSDGKIGINGDTTDAFFRINSTSSQNGFKIIGSAARAASRYAVHIDDNDTNSRGSVRIDTASGPSIISNADIQMAATSKLFLDGGGDTYIYEASADTLKIFVGGSSLLELGEGVTDYVRVLDNTYLGAGSSLDMYMRHDGTNSFLENGTGNLTIRNLTDDGDIILQSDDGAGGTTSYLTLDGSANTINVAKTMDFGDGADNVRVRLGAGQDLQLGHDGTNSFISNSTGNLDIKNFGDDKDIILYSDDGGGGVTAYITLDGSATAINVAKNLVSNNNVGFHQKDAAGNTAIIANLDSGDVLRIGDTTHVEQIAISTASTTNAMIFSSSGISMSGNVSMSSPMSCNYGLTINEGGHDSDTRIESDGNANMFRVDASTNRIGIGTGSPATTLEVDGILTMEDVTAPAEGVAGHAQMFSNGGEMKVNDASGNITTISPHNFELIPGGASEDMAFSYHSMKNTPEGKLKKVNVDMMKLARLVEELTGEKLVYIDEQ